MPRPPNRKTDVFKYINMHEGNKLVCWEWKREAKGGGRDNRPYFDVDGVKHLAYRLVYELTFGTKIPPNTMLLHSCDNQRCCNPWHVRPGEHVENMDDMKTRERHGLPHHAVKAIRRLLTEGKLTQKEIAQNFGVSRETISAIKRGIVYKHLLEEEKKP